MAGIYGNSMEDRYFEHKLNEYLDYEDCEMKRELRLEDLAEEAEYRRQEAKDYRFESKCNAWMDYVND